MLNGDEATKESTKKEIDITMGVKGAPNGLFVTSGSYHVVHMYAHQSQPALVVLSIDAGFDIQPSEA